MSAEGPNGTPSDQRPNVMFVMTDQQRFDTIAGLGNEHVHTPNLDRLVDSGVAFTNAYSQCPVCVPARQNVRTGCEMPTTGYWENDTTPADDLEDRTGPFLARAMGERGYRTVGVGMFHAFPYDLDLGYDVHHRRRAYDDWLADEHPGYTDVANRESGEFYYVPQTDALPAEATRAAWTVDTTIAELFSDEGGADGGGRRAGDGGADDSEAPDGTADDRPFFGMVSFMGPHPPFAPPEPFSRLYDPDEMPPPVLGDIDVDHADEQIPWMNHFVWATDGDGEPVGDLRARTLKARYYAEITHIDRQIGRLLDALEERGERENTVVAFFADHGELLGDHHGWQKESYFEAATRVPFLVSWPGVLPEGERCDELVCLTDLFGIATRAACGVDTREGIDVVGLVRGEAEPRDRLVGYYREPGSQHSKLMLREGDWKYVWMANGGREQLFDVAEDPDELDDRTDDEPAVVERLRNALVDELRDRGLEDALEGDNLRAFPYEGRERPRLGGDFPEDLDDLLAE